MADTRRFIEELHRAWRDEKGAALTYAAAAANETDARRRDIFLRMAAEEEKHAARWEARACASWAKPPETMLRHQPRCRDGGNWWPGIR